MGIDNGVYNGINYYQNTGSAETPLFENYTPVISVYLKRKIEEVLINHEPRIELTGIVINGDDFEQGQASEIVDAGRLASNDIDGNRLRIDIYFNIIGTPSPQSMSMNLQRLR